MGKPLPGPGVKSPAPGKDTNDLLKRASAGDEGCLPGVHALLADLMRHEHASLALAQLCRSFHGIICHEQSHIETDECGAPEFFSGGSKLLPMTRQLIMKLSSSQ
jgi:hypothetical protein